MLELKLWKYLAGLALSIKPHLMGTQLVLRRFGWTILCGLVSGICHPWLRVGIWVDVILEVVIEYYLDFGNKSEFVF